MAYIFESLTLADTFTPAILLMILTAYVFIQAWKFGGDVLEEREKEEEEEEDDFDDEPIIVLPSRRQFRRKGNRKTKRKKR